MIDGDDVSRPLPEDLFNDALELPPGERPAFLDAACADDSALRVTLRRMLALADADPGLTAVPETAGVPARLGKYELLEERGRGGMGVVYAARDLQLGRIVALKLLPAWMARAPEARDRFLREAQLLAALSDERIATLYSLDEADGFHFLTMEMIPGRTLADRLGEGPLPLLQALRLVQQVAQAMARAHAQHIVHRDLKPANLMITPDGGAKILDFGIARALSDAQLPDRPLKLPDQNLTRAQGTPGYMAPEQLAGGPIDESCDIWALGCILFETLSGQRAVDALDESGRLDTGSLPPALPREIRDLLRRCVERDPRHRDISAAEMARMLDRALAHHGGHRRRLLAGATVLALTAVLILFFGPLRDYLAERTLVSIEVTDSRVIRALDAKGRLVWTHVFPAPLARVHRGQAGTWGSDPPKIVRSGGQVRGVCVATGAENPGEPGALWFLSPRDGALLWRRPAAWQRPVNALGTLRIDWTSLLTWPGREAPVIVADIGDGGWYGSALQFLDCDGNALGTYHHPGPFGIVMTLNSPDGGPSRYVFAGTNSSARFVRALIPFESRAHVGCVVILEPPEVDGQGFPYSEGLPEPRDWPGMPRAREASYLAIPLIHPEFGSKVIGLTLNHDQDGRTVLTANTWDGRYYFLDEDLRPRSCYVRMKSVTDSLNALGEARFLPLMLIQNGRTSWIDLPPTF